MISGINDQNEEGDSIVKDGSPRAMFVGVEQKAPIISFVKDEFYLTDDLENTYEDAFYSANSVNQFIEKLLLEVVNQATQRQINKQIPEVVIGLSLDIATSCLEQLFVHIEDDPKCIEYTDKTTVSFDNKEPECIGLDTWARRRITNYKKGDSAGLQEVQCFGEQDPAIFFESQKRFQKAKDSVKMYLDQRTTEDQQPQPIELKQIVEVPSVEEQQLRALKEQQQLKNELKRNEERRRMENIKREKKGAASVKGMVTYDSEGGIIAIKPPNINKLGGVNFLVGVSIPNAFSKEENDDTLVNIPKANPLEEPFKLPSQVNKKNETVNKKIDISERNPFESIDQIAGVKFRYNNKEKVNPVVSATIKSGDLTRMTKDEYLKLVDEKGQQNKMMSRKAQQDSMVMSKQENTVEDTGQPMMDLGLSLKTQFAKTRFEKQDQVTRIKKSHINVKNSVKVEDLIVKDDFDFGLPNYKVKLAQKLLEKKQETETKKQTGMLSGGMSDLDEFNLQLLKKGSEANFDASHSKNNLPPSKLRPIKSDVDLIAKSLGNKIKYPRERMFHDRNYNKFETLKNMLNQDSNRNIFKKVT